MSTDNEGQQASVPRQRGQVVPYGRQKSYTVVQEYVDEGIAGDEFDRRPGFQRLLKDATAGKFDVILVDEPSRLSRQDPIDFIVKVVDPLRKAGVSVDAVSCGPLDYDSLAGLIMSVIHQDKASGESKSLSRRVLTGLVKQAKEGWRAPSVVPYAYRVLRTGEDGRRLQEGEGPRLGADGKKEKLRRKLVPGPEEEVRVVRWIYDVIANHGWTVGQVVRELALRGVKPPRGNGHGKTKETGLWDKNTVRRLVRRRCYCGDQRWNETGNGKYSELRGGEVVAVAAGNRRWRVHAEADMVLVKDAECITPLVDRDLWRRANTALEGNRKMTNPRPAGQPRHLFTHLLVCADCGGYMVGKTDRKGTRYYICPTYQRQGKHACHANRVNEADIEAKVCEVLEREYLNPDRLEALRQSMTQKLRAMRDAGEVKQLQKQVAELSARIDRGNENLAILPPDRIAGVVAKVREWEGQRDQLQARARQLQEGEAEIAQTIKLAEGHLWRLREALQSGGSARVRSVYREMIAKVELHFAHRRAGKLTVSKFVKGVLFLRPGLGTSHLELLDC
jgi:DNA invertase Pin-like site-specific DNA recombinase